MASSDVEHTFPVEEERLSMPDDFHEKSAKKFTVRKSDLDINNHVNNIRYIEWILEVLPADQPVRKLDIAFRAECGYDDVIISKYLQTDTGNQHVIERESDGRVLAVAKTSY